MDLGPHLGRRDVSGSPSGGPRDYLAFMTSGRRLAIELDAVDRAVAMVAITPLPAAPDVVLGAIDVAGDVVPVLDLGRRLGLPQRSFGADTVLLLVRTPARTVGIAADEVLGVHSIPAGVTGVAALEDGLLVIEELDMLAEATGAGS